MKAPLTDPTKGPYYQTLSTNPTEPGGFYNQPPLIVPKKLWQTPLNFDDPHLYGFCQIRKKNVEKERYN